MKTGLKEEDSCQGKKAYDKRGAISAANKRWEEDHIRLRIYQHHNHWHLTKSIRGNPYKSKRNRKNIEARKTNPRFNRNARNHLEAMNLT